MIHSSGGFLIGGRKAMGHAGRTSANGHRPRPSSLVRTRTMVAFTSERVFMVLWADFRLPSARRTRLTCDVAEQAIYGLADTPLFAVEIAFAHGVAVATGEHHPVGSRVALFNVGDSGLCHHVLMSSCFG